MNMTRQQRKELESSVWNETEMVVSKMKDEKKDEIFKKIIGEKAYETWESQKDTQEYKRERDNAIASSMWDYNVDSSSTGPQGQISHIDEKMLKGWKEAINKLDLSNRYKKYALKGLEKHEGMANIVKQLSGDDILDPSKLRYSSKGENSSRTYVYDNMISIDFENSPEQMRVSNLITGEVFYLVDPN